MNKRGLIGLDTPLPEVPRKCLFVFVWCWFVDFPGQFVAAAAGVILNMNDSLLLYTIFQSLKVSRSPQQTIQANKQKSLLASLHSQLISAAFSAVSLSRYGEAASSEFLLKKKFLRFNLVTLQPHPSSSLHNGSHVDVKCRTEIAQCCQTQNKTSLEGDLGLMVNNWCTVRL